jgi:LacI family transcriptional regulator
MLTDTGRLAGPVSSSTVTLYDVAREAGVSTATVSRVIHGQDRVRASTRQRVLEVIEARGYVPDAAAQSMARQRKEVIGLVVRENRSPDTEIEQEGLLFIEEVMRGIESTLSQIEWSLLVSVLRDTDADSACRQMLKLSGKVDGMLIAEGIVSSSQLEVLAARVPVTLVAGSPLEPHADVVTVDNRGGTKALVSHLVHHHGMTSLFYIAGPSDAPDARERRSAFTEALAEHHGAACAGVLDGRFAAISGQLAVQQMLSASRGELPDAVICGNDQMAIGAIRQLQTLGIAVPADVAVVGFDGMPLGAMLAPALTTVRQPMRLLGQRACLRLLHRIGDPALPRHAEQLLTDLVIRESCGCSERLPRPASTMADAAHPDPAP